MSLETEIPELLFSEMKDFIESSSDLDRQSFNNNEIKDLKLHNG